MRKSKLLSSLRARSWRLTLKFEYFFMRIFYCCMKWRYKLSNKSKRAWNLFYFIFKRELIHFSDFIHEIGIKVLLDLVPNHTSDKHEWFQKSVKKIAPYTNYYVWKDAKYVNGVRHPPNNWVSGMEVGNFVWFLTMK